MRVAVDQNICQGHALCQSFTSDLFEVDEDTSKAFALVDVVPADREDAARMAITNCPEGAITVVE